MINGVILAAGLASKETIEQLKQKDIPFFLLERSISSSKAPYAAVDLKKCGEISAKYLLERNHKKIGLMLYANRFPTMRISGESFLNILKQAGIDPEFILEIDAIGLDTAILKNEIEDKIDMIKKSNVSAIYCNTDLIPMFLIDILEAHNIKVPHDISIMSRDNHPYGQSSAKRLTTTENDIKKLGEIAVKNLVNKIEKGKFLSKKTIIDPAIVVGDTVRKI